MAVYEYKCDSCLIAGDFQHSMEDTMDWDDCPFREDCKGYLHRVFTAPAVSFKGGGWGKVYRTYKAKGD